MSTRPVTLKTEEGRASAPVRHTHTTSMIEGCGRLRHWLHVNTCPTTSLANFRGV